MVLIKFITSYILYSKGNWRIPFYFLLGFYTCDLIYFKLQLQTWDEMEEYEKT